MAIARRDVLKMLTAAPFVGLAGAPALRVLSVRMRRPARRRRW